MLNRHLCSIIIIVAMFFSVFAQPPGLEFKFNPRLKFHADGKFKVVQFTDVHYERGSSKNEALITMISDILNSEKPDLVMLTGDIVTSRPERTGWKVVVRPCIERKIPWAVTMGNHDDESDLTKEEIMAMLKKMPYSLVQPGPKSLGAGGNYVISIKDSRGHKNALLLYLLDSNSYTTLDGVGKYGWITFEQIRWFRQRSTHFRILNENKPVPGAVFFHIPLPEYYQLWEFAHTKCIGTKNDEICSPAINSGMFASMRESEGIVGVFVGHDHDNDFAGNLYNICLAYGRVSGYDTYGSLPRGARVIEFTEKEREFTSWIHTENGEVVNRFHYPKSFR